MLNFVKLVCLAQSKIMVNYQTFLYEHMVIIYYFILSRHFSKCWRHITSHNLLRSPFRTILSRLFISLGSRLYQDILNEANINQIRYFFYNPHAFYALYRDFGIISVIIASYFQECIIIQKLCILHLSSVFMKLLKYSQEPFPPTLDFV